jgi:hypothetical protein
MSSRKQGRRRAAIAAVAGGLAIALAGLMLSPAASAQSSPYDQAQPFPGGSGCDVTFQPVATGVSITSPAARIAAALGRTEAEVQRAIDQAERESRTAGPAQRTRVTMIDLSPRAVEVAARWLGVGASDLRSALDAALPAPPAFTECALPNAAGSVASGTVTLPPSATTVAAGPGGQTYSLPATASAAQPGGGAGGGTAPVAGVRVAGPPAGATGGMARVGDVFAISGQPLPGTGAFQAIGAPATGSSPTTAQPGTRVSGPDVLIIAVIDDGSTTGPDAIFASVAQRLGRGITAAQVRDAFDAARSPGAGTDLMSLQIIDPEQMLARLAQLLGVSVDRLRPLMFQPGVVLPFGGPTPRG